MKTIIENCNTEEMWTLFAKKYDDCFKKYVPKIIPKKDSKLKPLWIYG